MDVSLPGGRSSAPLLVLCLPTRGTAVSSLPACLPTVVYRLRVGPSRCGPLRWGSCANGSGSRCARSAARCRACSCSARLASMRSAASFTGRLRSSSASARVMAARFLVSRALRWCLLVPNRRPRGPRLGTELLGRWGAGRRRFASRERTQRARARNGRLRNISLRMLIRGSKPCYQWCWSFREGPGARQLPVGPSGTDRACAAYTFRRSGP